MNKQRNRFEARIAVVEPAKTIMQGEGGEVKPDPMIKVLLDYVDTLEAALRAIDRRQAQLANEDDVDKCYNDIEKIIHEALNKGKE